MIRWICSVRPQDHVNSNDLLAKLGLADIGKVLRSRRLRWFGHAVRSQECINSVMDVVVVADEEEKKKGCSGRPRKTWMECVRNDVTACNLESVDPLDRVKWRKAIKVSLLLPTPVSVN